MGLNETIRAVADPTRREILRLLRDGDRTAGDIAERFPMTAATVSHHLNVLKEAKLVQAEREGRNVTYSLNETVFQQFMEELVQFFGAGGER